MEDLIEAGSGWEHARVAGWGLGLLAGAAVVLSTQGRPLVKGVIVGYLALSERLRELGAETVEQFQDLYEEARAEYAGVRTDGDSAEMTITEEPPPSSSPPRPRAGRGVSGSGGGSAAQ